MTTENLHHKAAIAEQLAWRDQQIDELRKRAEAAEAELTTNVRVMRIDRDHYKAQCHALEAQIAGLKAAQPKQEWIPLSERMPVHGEAVWFFVDGWGVFWGAVEIDRNNQYWFDDQDGVCTWPSSSVTHWMPRVKPPVPAPPEKEE
jgi:hypothetical protein